MNLQRLRELTEAATQGRREAVDLVGEPYAAYVHVPELGEEAPEIMVCLSEKDAALAAAADPEVVRALIDVAEAAEKLDAILTSYKGSPLAAAHADLQAWSAHLDTVLIHRGDR